VGLVAPSGLVQVGELPRVNPGLSFPGHFGPQIGMGVAYVPRRDLRGQVPTCDHVGGISPEK
jgi:hypothetical protein